jgi:hypothetical protein
MTYKFSANTIYGMLESGSRFVGPLRTILLGLPRDSDKKVRQKSLADDQAMASCTIIAVFLVRSLQKAATSEAVLAVFLAIKPTAFCYHLCQ